MGSKGRTSDRDKEIADLKASLSAEKVKSSHYKDRLLQALDDLDRERVARSTDVLRLRETNKKLRLKLEYARSQANEANEKREEMAGSVNELIEKVENHSLDQWPHSSMRLTRFVDPLVPPTANKPQDDVTAYAVGMIASLRVQRDLALSKMERMEKESQQRITLLEAQVARRDAEFQTRSTRYYQSQQRPVVDSKMAALRDEEVIEILEQRSTRNKSLEAEIVQLSKKLTELRTSGTEEVSPSRPVTRGEDETTIQPSAPTAIGLGEEVARLGATIDGFISTRKQLEQYISLERQAISPLQLDADSATSERSSVRDRLEASLRREQELAAENERLRHLLADPLASSGQLIDEPNGEISMDLATPLMPSIFIPPPSLTSAAEPIDPPTIPLPPSPPSPELVTFNFRSTDAAPPTQPRASPVPHFNDPPTRQTHVSPPSPGPQLPIFVSDRLPTPSDVREESDFLDRVQNSPVFSPPT